MTCSSSSGPTRTSRLGEERCPARPGSSSRSHWPASPTSDRSRPERRDRRPGPERRRDVRSSASRHSGRLGSTLPRGHRGRRREPTARRGDRRRAARRLHRSRRSGRDFSRDPSDADVRWRMQSPGLAGRFGQEDQQCLGAGGLRLRWASSRGPRPGAQTEDRTPSVITGGPANPSAGPHAPLGDV